jgi:hypothetical protein
MRSSETTPSGISWEITPNDRVTSTFKLSGNLKPGWLGPLSSYMSQEKINIVKGTACKCSAICWDGLFEIEKGFRPIEIGIDFNPIKAFNEFSGRHAGELSSKISNMSIKRSTRHGGSVYVEITGEDCIGFLSSIMGIFSFCSLFPTELEVTTKGHAVFDQFWLKGIGLSIPTDEDITLLHERLSRYQQ